MKTPLCISVCLLAWLRKLMPLVLVTAFGIGEPVSAQDWPQALGVNRDCRTEYRLSPNWTVEQIQLSWEVDAGEGYAGPIVAGDSVYLYDRVGKSLRLRSVRLKDGAENWVCEIEATYAGGIDADKGPRATPTLADGLIYAWSAGGILTCVSAEDGKVVWKKNLGKDMPGGEGYFGYGGGPLVIGETVLVNIGSRGAAIVGLDKSTGDLLWETGKDEASYAAPISVKLAGKEAALFITRLHFYVVDPVTGRVFAQSDFGKRGATVNAASPVLLDGHQVFLNAAYGIGAKVLKLPDDFESEAVSDEPNELKVIWEDVGSFASQYTTPVYSDGYLYGTSGREDFNDGQLRCISANDGKLIWNESKWPLAHGILAGDRLLLLTLDSRLVVVAPTPDGFKKLGEKQLSASATRPLPALANGNFIFRTIGSVQDQPKWYCYRLSN